MIANDRIIEYRFSGYRLETIQRKLFNQNGELMNLSSRAFDALLVLVENHGDTLSKSQLMEAVWPNSVVEENNLNQAIFGLRRALGDCKNESSFIKTVPGRGYCFIAPVEICRVLEAPLDEIPHTSPVFTPAAAPITQASTPAEALTPVLSARRGPLHMPSGQPAFAAKDTLRLAGLATFALLAGTGIYMAWQLPGALQNQVETSVLASQPAGATPIDAIANSLAVMPFTNLNPEADSALFALSLHDEIISQLSKIKSLKVIARNRVLALADEGDSSTEIAHRLRVESVMSGTILVTDENARINLQMVDSTTGIALWTGTYEANKEDLSEMISIQSDIAVQVAATLQTEIEQSEREKIVALPTESFEAYRYNMAARIAHYQQDYRQEWHLSRQALELDPDYFEALYTFAKVNAVVLATPLPGMSSSDHVRMTLETAERLIALAPNRNEGYSLKAVAIATGRRWQDAAAIVDQLETMQLPEADMRHVALLLMCFGNFDRAVKIYEAHLGIYPMNHDVRGFLVAAYELAGNRKASRLEYATGEELSDIWWGDTVNIFLALGRGEAVTGVHTLAGISEELKYLLLHLHNRPLVAAKLEAFRASADKIAAEAVYYAAIAAHVDENELAIEFMRASLKDVWTGVYWVWLPVFDKARRLDSFRNLLQESGLVAYWKQNGWTEVCQPEGETFSCDWSAWPGLPVHPPAL